MESACGICAYFRKGTEFLPVLIGQRDHDGDEITGVIDWSEASQGDALTAVGLSALGTGVGRLTGRPVLRSGLRQLALGALAIAVTYGVGRLIGSHS